MSTNSKLKWKIKNALSEEMNFGEIIEQVFRGPVDILFSEYYAQLLEMPTPHLVKAVWGNNGFGTLTGIQQEIHNRLSPAVEEAIELFGAASLNEKQRKSIRYYICSMLIYRIGFMVEKLRYCLDNRAQSSHDDNTLLDRETIGNA